LSNIVVKRQVPLLPNCWSQMLWNVSNKLQVNILASSSKENFYKHIKRMKFKFRKDRWKIKIEYSTLEELTSNMKPPHCCTWKCQKPSQLLSSWMVPLLTVPNKYHQDRMVAYWRSTSSKDLAFSTHNIGLCVDHGIWM